MEGKDGDLVTGFLMITPPVSPPATFPDSQPGSLLDCRQDWLEGWRLGPAKLLGSLLAR